MWLEIKYTDPLCNGGPEKEMAANIILLERLTVTTQKDLNGKE